MTGKIDITKISIEARRIPDGFKNTKILHISDLHNARFGNGQKVIIETVRGLNPDYIFITGDLIDRKYRKIRNAIDLIKGIKTIAPIYYVTGNHEWESKETGRVLWENLHESGVNILHDQIVNLKRNGQSIQLMGIDDPYCLNQKKNAVYDRASSEFFLIRLRELLKKKKKGCLFLLSHRPEFIHFYAKAGIDVVFSGHAHGGQIRVPGIGGVLAPHQGFFPKYAEGMVKENNTLMIISRGLGNSTFPIRINNHPELILATLE